MKIKNLITLFCFICTISANCQIKKADIEAAITLFPAVFTKKEAKIIINSNQENFSCVAPATKIEVKENAVYLYEYYDVKKTDLSRLFILPFSSIKDLYSDSNLIAITLLN